jgi:hypothetical protein
MWTVKGKRFFFEKKKQKTFALFEKRVGFEVLIHLARA